MNLNKIAQKVYYKFNTTDDSFLVLASINTGDNIIKFEAKNIWLDELTTSDKYQLKQDLKDLAEFLIQLSEEIPA
jgi:hypothetical protein